jgi:hypothetical protein
MKKERQGKRRKVKRGYVVDTEQKTQRKRRRRNQEKAYQRAREVDAKVYPNDGVQYVYERPNQKEGKKRRKGKAAWLKGSKKTGRRKTRR